MCRFPASYLGTLLILIHTCETVIGISRSIK
jgi:hypothetical protein